MPALRVACPSCDANVTIKNPALAGKTVECPKCGEPMVLPELDDEPEPDDDYDRPRKKKSKRYKKAAAGGALVRNLAGGAVLLVLLGVGAVVWINRSKDKPAETTDAGSGTVPKNAAREPERPVITGANPPKITTGSQPETANPAPAPKLPYDIAKLGYDPAKPDFTIPAVEWPRRSGPGDAGLVAYNDKVIVTEGRIYAIEGTDAPEGRTGPQTPTGPRGPVRFYFYLFDAGGKLFGADGKAVAVGVHFPPGNDWKRYRPGQVVKVAGRGRTPKDAPTSLDLYNSVVLSVAGEGHPPMTTEQFATAVATNPKEYASNFTTCQYVTLKAVVSGGTGTTLTLVHPSRKVTCQISNVADLQANPPKSGDTVTLIVRATTNPYGGTDLDLRGLYLSK